MGERSPAGMSGGRQTDPALFPAFLLVEHLLDGASSSVAASSMFLAT